MSTNILWEVFFQKPKGVVCNFVKSEMHYGSEAWCFGQNDIGFLQREDHHAVGCICCEVMGQGYGKRSCRCWVYVKIADQLVNGYSVCWHVF